MGPEFHCCDKIVGRDNGKCTNEIVNVKIHIKLIKKNSNIDSPNIIHDLSMSIAKMYNN